MQNYIQFKLFRKNKEEYIYTFFQEVFLLLIKTLFQELKNQKFEWIINQKLHHNHSHRILVFHRQNSRRRTTQFKLSSQNTQIRRFTQICRERERENFVGVHQVSRRAAIQTRPSDNTRDTRNSWARYGDLNEPLR